MRKMRALLVSAQIWPTPTLQRLIHEAQMGNVTDSEDGWLAMGRRNSRWPATLIDTGSTLLRSFTNTVFGQSMWYSSPTPHVFLGSTRSHHATNWRAPQTLQNHCKNISIFEYFKLFVLLYHFLTSKLETAKRLHLEYRYGRGYFTKEILYRFSFRINQRLHCYLLDRLVRERYS